MIADVPHLLKNLRNAWMKFDFILPDDVVKKYSLPTNIVSKSAVRQLILFQEKNAFLMQSRLKIDHLQMTNSFAKMRVQPAEAVFSHATAAAIRTLVKKYGYDENFLTTAFFIEKVAVWYERLTSREKVMAFSYKKMDKFEEAIDELKEFSHMIDNTILSKVLLDGQEARIPIQSGIVMTTLSMIEIIIFLLDIGFLYVEGGKFTSEPVENVFSCVRKRTLHPTGKLTLKQFLLYFFFS